MPTTYAIPNGAPYMQASLYTGTGATQTITTTAQLGSGAMIWTKTRSNAVNWDVHSSAGAQTYSFLQTNTTNAEDSSASQYSITYANGSYTLGTGDNINQSGRTFVGYQWAAGASASNTSGSITSTTYANTTAGFSVVTYTHNGTNSATVGHGLGVTPSFIINKQRSAASNWRCYHVSLPAGYNIQLNLTSAQGTAADIFPTAPTSSVFTPGNGDSASGQTFVAYCFAPVAGYSAFGSYTGNGSSDGPFVYTNMRSRFVMIKRTDSAGYDWVIYDTSRNTYNAVTLNLDPNSSAAETNTGSSGMDITSNGFKLRDGSLFWNASGGTYIYACFGENPLKFANAR
jgi:hypothetical protein